MAKDNNNKKYPEANRQPRQKAAERIGKAQARQEDYDKLSLEEKLSRLPPAPLCSKQRARLLAQLSKKNAPKQEPAQEKSEPQAVSAETSKNPNNQKKYMKGAKQQ